MKHINLLGYTLIILLSILSLGTYYLYCQFNNQWLLPEWCFSKKTVAVKKKPPTFTSTPAISKRAIGTIRSPGLFHLKGTIKVPDSFTKFSKPVFLFPGNVQLHHKKGVVKLDNTDGSGLAGIATELNDIGLNSLSLPSQNGKPCMFDDFLDPRSIYCAEIKSIHARTILACWYLLGKGAQLILPVRRRTNFFNTGLQSDNNLEPSWWGNNNKYESPKYASQLIELFDELKKGQPSIRYSQKWECLFRNCRLKMTPISAFKKGQKDSGLSTLELPDDIQKP